MIGVFGLLALAAIGYGVYSCSSPLYVSTDDATFAPTTPRLARGWRHVAAILPATMRLSIPAT